MHHIPEDHRGTAIAHMFRVLRPGGRLLIADIYPTGRLLPAVMRALTRITQHGDDQFGDLDVRRYIPALQGAGFAQVACTTVKPWAGYLTAAKPA